MVSAASPELIGSHRTGLQPWPRGYASTPVGNFQIKEAFERMHVASKVEVFDLVHRVGGARIHSIESSHPVVPIELWRTSCG
eukprot:10848297-Heterocapsa_arctica.AAC.1